MEQIKVQKIVHQDVGFKKWVQIWDTIQDQVADLPVWAQETLFDDINTTVQNRVTVMHKTQKANVIAMA